MAVAKGIPIQNFVGNSSWCIQIMHRNNLSMHTKTTLCQQVPADLEEKLKAFRAFMSESISEDFICLDSIINMDKVLLSFVLHSQQEGRIVSEPQNYGT